jgi:nucleoside-diphosphate-sugar epimerase
VKRERVFVTGATGFTGGHLCRRLVAEGHQVRALVRDPARTESLRQLGVDLVSGDLRDGRSLTSAVKGADVVYHIAALFRPENVSRQDMWEVNVQGTRDLLDASVNAGVGRFVHCSTIGVHGDIKNPPAN